MMHGLICLLVTTSLVDRSTLSVAMPTIVQELHLSGSQIGLIFSGFLWTFALIQVPAALLVDRFGIRSVNLIAATAWAVVTALTGFASGFTSLLLFRILLGTAEAPVFPAAIKVVHSWFEPASRGRAMAIIEMVVKFGYAISPLVGAVLVTRFGWRPMFFILAVISAVPALLWFLYYRSPSNDPFLTPEEHQRIGLGSVMPEAGQSILQNWFNLFRHPQTWLMIAGGMLLAPLLAVGYWLPMFLKTEFGFDTLKTGQVMTYIGIAGIVGALLGGLLSDGMVRRGHSVIGSARLVIVIGLLAGAATLVMANHSLSAAWMVFALTLNSFATSLIYAPAWALVAAIAPRPTLVASMGGLQNGGVAAGAGLSTFMCGALLDLFGTYQVAFDLCAVLAVASAMIYAFSLRIQINIL